MAKTVGRFELDVPFTTRIAPPDKAPVLYFRSFQEEQSRAGFKAKIRKHQQMWKDRKGAYLLASRSRPTGKFFSEREFRYNIAPRGRSKFDEQRLFAEVLEQIGPYVALARLEDRGRLDFGAQKVFVDDNKWQSEVQYWLQICAAVVIEIDTTSSILWEIEQIVQFICPTRILLLFPFYNKKYKIFREKTHHLFPKSLPPDRPPSRLITFSSQWEPIILDNPNMIVEDALVPFFEQNAFPI